MPDVLATQNAPQPIPANQQPQTNPAVRADASPTLQQRPDLVVGDAQDTVNLSNDRRAEQEVPDLPDRELIESLNNGDAVLQFRFDTGADKIILELVDSNNGQFLATIPIGQATGFTAQLIDQIRTSTGSGSGESRNEQQAPALPPLTTTGGTNAEQQTQLVGN